MAFVIGLLECVALFLIFFALFRTFNWSNKVRNYFFYFASYPGVFGAAAGWIGIVFPVPMIFALPMLAETLGNNNASWAPVPFFSMMLGTEGPTDVVIAFIAGEAMLLLAWALVVWRVHVAAKKQTESALTESTH